MMNRTATTGIERYRAAVKAIGGHSAIYGLPKPVRDALQVARSQEAKARILETYIREIPAMHCRLVK